jgi:hypothetical protein
MLAPSRTQVGDKNKHPNLKRKIKIRTKSKKSKKNRRKACLTLAVTSQCRIKLAPADLPSWAVPVPVDLDYQIGTPWGSRERPQSSVYPRIHSLLRTMTKTGSYERSVFCLNNMIRELSAAIDDTDDDLTQCVNDLMRATVRVCARAA